MDGIKNWVLETCDPVVLGSCPTFVLPRVSRHIINFDLVALPFTYNAVLRLVKRQVVCLRPQLYPALFESKQQQHI